MGDVLKQAQASLSAFIGSVRYGSAVDPAAALQGKTTRHDDSRSDAIAGAGSVRRQPGATGMGGMENLYDSNKLNSAVKHANEICNRYGVTIISINIISAVPIDKRLQEALAKGAVAAAEAEQAETAAAGNAKALLIKTQSEADATLVSADADAQACRIRAKGNNDAAKTLEESKVAVELARIDQCGKACSDKSTFFFGASAGDIPALFSNSGVVNKRS